MFPWSRRFGDTKGVIRIRKSKDRQPNGQKKKYIRINNALQNTTQKTKHRATGIPLKTKRVNTSGSGKESKCCSTKVIMWHASWSNDYI